MPPLGFFMTLPPLAPLRTRGEAGIWYRAIQVRHLGTPLKTGHTRHIPSRFNSATQPPRRRFRILYLAENHMVALFEVAALLGSPTGHPGVLPAGMHAWTILNVNVDLRRVADLTNPNETDKLTTTAQELTGDWRAYQQRGILGTVRLPVGSAPTQQLGEALRANPIPPGLIDAGPNLEGFLTLSARLPYHRILVIFPDNLDSNSAVKWENPLTGQWEDIID